MKFSFNNRTYLLKSDRNLSFTEIDFYKPAIIQGLDRHLVCTCIYFLKEAKLSNNAFIFLKHLSVE